MSDHLHSPITLVVGGTGKTGRRVAERLSAQDLPVRIGSRSGEPPFDWDRPETWPAAVEGVTAAYVAFHPDLAVPGAAERVGAFARTAVDHGVRQLVLLSGRGEPEAQRAEEAVQAAGAEWTVVRCSFFAQNFSESFWLEDVVSGTVVLPADGVREPFVDADDIADVAVAALTEPGHAGSVYELTGPRALSFAEAVAEIADATGRDVRFESMPVDAYASLLSAHQVPPDAVALLTYLFGEVLDGRNAHPADGVRQALGRAPRDFGDYARATAATGVWNPADRVVALR